MSAACPAVVAGETWRVATCHWANQLATEKTTNAAMEGHQARQHVLIATTRRTAVATLTVSAARSSSPNQAMMRVTIPRNNFAAAGRIPRHHI